MTLVTVRYGQCLLDIAVQYLGDATRAIEVAELNGISITDELTAGETLLVPEPSGENRSLVQLFSQPKNIPASGGCVIAGDVDAGDGIGYWFIEYDFIVS